MIRSRCMKAHEVVAALSLSEFNRLCAAIDEKLPPSESVQDGPGTVRLLGRLVSKRFGVIRVQRIKSDEILVMVDLGSGNVKWFGIQPDEKKKKAA